MAEINQSLSDGVCIDEEVFFGPITDKERRIREQFENVYKSENKITGELPKINENDISRNDSLYLSFSVEDSKYDSFDDSLNEDLDKKLQGAKHASLRKSLEKLKHKKQGFYDSLEDVCSLASNIEKCSISCEVENGKQHIVDDSLRNLPTTVNKSCVNEQIHFDDDSLAVVEIENTFDDSLEEFNVLSSIEVEEINDAEILSTEHQNVSSKLEQTPPCVSRNLFEASVQVIYESKKEVDLEESSGDKNNLYDSLSNSDLKDILKDSLEESEKCVDNILRHVSDVSVINIKKSEQFNFCPNVKIDDEKPTVSELKIGENINGISGNHFDTSVQIIEKEQETLPVNQQESSEDKNDLYDSLSNSDVKDIVDSLEESERCIANLHVSNAPPADIEKLEQISIKSDILDDSVQIVYENLHSDSKISNGDTDSQLNILKHTFKNLQNSRDLVDQTIAKTGAENISLSSCIDVTKKPVNDSNNDNSTLCLDSNANQSCKASVDRLQLISGKSNFCTSDIESQNFNKDTFTVDSCHLKLLDDSINVDKNLKFELHIEVTVGDKKCKIAAEDIKLLPVTNLNSKINESKHSLAPVESESCMTKERPDVPDSCNSQGDYKNNEFNTNSENILNCNSNENDMYQEQKTISEINVTRRSKAVSQRINNSDLKFDFCDNLDHKNLLQALDLHDISTSFLNESIIQSNDSVIPLNLCTQEQDIENIKKCLFRNESKENISESLNYCPEKAIGSPSKRNQSKSNYRKTPKSAQKSPSSKETKRTPGTKIPVRKVENFVVPTIASSKLTKQISSSSVEKVKKYPYSQTPHSAEKKTPISTSCKTPHFCKVRNTIFSKVPQIVPSKKYINIQSPVAQYIRNTPGSAKTPILDPVLRDCMNHMHQQMESPYHLYQVPKSGSAKSTKRKV